MSCYLKVAVGYSVSLHPTLNDTLYRKFWAFCGDHGNLLWDVAMCTMPTGPIFDPL